MTKIIVSMGGLLKTGVAVAALGSLSGCILITDTSRMNIETFQDEIAPVYYEPARVQPNEFQTRPPGRALYQNQLYTRDPARDSIAPSTNPQNPSTRAAM